MCVCVCVLSCIWLFATPWTVAHQALLSMEFPRQKYWNVLYMGFIYINKGSYVYIKYISIFYISACNSGDTSLIPRLGRPPGEGHGYRVRVPWTARRPNQSILKEISPGCSLEGLMLKLKLQYFGHLMRRVDSLVKTLMLGGIGGRRRRGQQSMRWLDGITNSMGMSLS